MSSGKYDKRVEILTRSSAKNAMKEDIVSWNSGTPRKKLWAEVQRGTGGERRVSAAQEQSSLPASIFFRFTEFSSQIAPDTHRLRFDGKDWDIVSAAEGARRRREWLVVAITRN